jgi:hypothetical protein
MPFGEYCEQCRRTPIDFNSQSDTPVESFDYCALCSKDLCPDCFKNPCWNDVTLERNADQHQPSGEAEVPTKTDSPAADEAEGGVEVLNCYKNRFRGKPCPKPAEFKGRGTFNFTDDWTWCASHAPSPDYRVRLSQNPLESD